MVGVHALTQVIKEDTAMQHSSIQMPSDLTLLMAKVLALFKEGVCMGGGGRPPNYTEFRRNCNYFLFLLSFQAKNTVIFSTPVCRTASPAA